MKDASWVDRSGGLMVALSAEMMEGSMVAIMVDNSVVRKVVRLADYWAEDLVAR